MRFSAGNKLAIVRVFSQMMKVGFGSITVINGHIHQILQRIEGNVDFHHEAFDGLFATRREDSSDAS